MQNRTTHLALLLLTALTAVLAGCNDQGDEKTGDGMEKDDSMDGDSMGGDAMQRDTGGDQQDAMDSHESTTG